MRGWKDSLQIIADFMGPVAPKADPELKDPRSALAIALYYQLDQLTGSELNKLLKEIYEDEHKPSTRTTVLKRVKTLINEMLDIDSTDDVHDPMAAWKMWPLVIHRKEKKMATNKQATKKKSASKRVSKKKKVTKKKGIAKKTVTKKVASAGKRGKDAGKKLLKPVKKASKRGAVLAKFTLKTAKTPDAVAKELKTTRSNVMSHLHDLNKYHGIGYELHGDKPVEIFLPKGCKSPWT